MYKSAKPSFQFLNVYAIFACLLEFHLDTIFVGYFVRPIVVDQLRQTAVGFAITNGEFAALQTDNSQNGNVHTRHFDLHTTELNLSLLRFV
jgi:hypothetical protein